MDASTTLTLVQTILQMLDSSIYSEAESLLGYKSQLDKLKTTMSIVQAVLLNAEKQEMQQPPSQLLQITLERLKEAVYQADDLFDEVNTVVQRKRLMDGNKVSKEVRLFFSRFNQLHHAFTTSRQISKIRGILGDIERNHNNFWSMQMVNSEVKKNNPRETHSFVCEDDVIIGRDNDKRIVIDMLLDPNVEEVVSVISIVGIGGMGKTTLAQLVYNDDTIVREFPLKMWVCVSEDFDVRVLIEKILVAGTHQSINSSLSMDQLQSKLREKFNGKKFLLVLDDIWNEDHSKWQELRKLLKQGGKESRVIVTTRSRKVAYIVGSHKTHELRGLSKEESWSLFERMALEPGQVQFEEGLIKIGKEIVRKCVNVPLAIRIAGSLVQGKPEESWWEYLKNIDLANMKRDGENGIVNVLKISYHYLPRHLKSCFTYCAVFPKDYRIKKEVLIELWVAQGYILPLDGKSFEVAGEEYFMNLLQRCFFQDVKRDDDGGILSCKMHDLIHDLAKEVAGTGIGTNSSKDQQTSSNDKILHLFLSNDIDDECYLTNIKRLHTLLMPVFPSISNAQLPLKMRYLRVLDLHRCGFEKLPSKIGELLHLRYLDLSDNKLSFLPSSIIQLYNLQTLKLIECTSLKELPRNLRKLVNLRHLDIQGCDSLRHMPPGMNSMTSLQKLPMFVVCKTDDVSGCVPPIDNFGGLGELKNLNYLKGHMKIKVETGWTYDTVEVREGGYLINKPHLRDIEIIWDVEREENNNAKALLQGLQPHSNIRRLRLEYYPGVSFPSWGDSSMNLKSCLPTLVEIKLQECRWLDHLPLLSQLPYLKVLTISNLEKLEYMERRSSSSESAKVLSRGSTREDELVFFPSLKKLEFFGMDELKGWWKTPSHADSKLTFPHLSELKIIQCPKLISFPFCLKLETLDLRGFNRAIGPIMRVESLMPDRMNDESPAASTSTSNNRKQQSQGLRELRTDDVGFLKCQPKEAFQHLSVLKIWNDTKIETLTTGEVGELFESGCLSSLCELDFTCCTKLKSISGQGVWEQFTALETLQLHGLEEMELEEEEDDVNGIDAHVPWKCLALTLRTLKIFKLPKVVKLPRGMQHLTALQTLEISLCKNLEELPVWIGCLSSLQRLDICACERVKSFPEEMRHLKCLTHLYIQGCSTKLKERCQELTGADWPNIEHIPHIDV